MSSAQVETLREFAMDTLRGTVRFDFTHPRTLETVEVRIVPQQDGALFSLSYLLPEYWQVSLQLEVLP
jgi:transcriptional regulator of nitric oxide reductase